MPGNQDKSNCSAVAIIILLFVVDTGLLCGVISMLLTRFLPVWAACILGILAGLVLTVIFWRTFCDSEGKADFMDIIIPHAAIFVLAVVFFPFFATARANARANQQTTACLQNLHLVGEAVLSYAQDWDDTFPPANRWGDAAIADFDPQEVSALLRCPAASSAYGYAFNRNLDQLPKSKVNPPAQIIMLFEANADNPNAAGNQSIMVRSPRHRGANNYTFADGHAKSIDADAQSNLTWQAIPR
jgi:prepilin-type processing-associated H-X9-DG protein